MVRLGRTMVIVRYSQRIISVHSLP